MPILYTVGHSNHSLETLIGLLQQHQITAVVDVRSHPYSRYLPHFNKKELQIALKSVNIHYVFLGQELGARPQDLSCYHQGKALYERIAKTELFRQGLQRLQKGLEGYKISLLCAEKDPITCHRTILVSRQLRKIDPDLEINHILPDGFLESHCDLEKRLLKIQGFGRILNLEEQPKQLSLFDLVNPSPELTWADYLEKAYQKQGDQIEFVDQSLSESNVSLE